MVTVSPCSSVRFTAPVMASRSSVIAPSTTAIAAALSS
jgi:hypothetical protein